MTDRQPRRTRLAIAGLVVAALALPLGPIGSLRAAEPPSAVARRHLAQLDGGSPEGYAVVYERTLAGGQGALGATAGWWAGKLVDAAGRIRTVYVAPDGTVGDASLYATRIQGGLAALDSLALKADAALQHAVASSAALGPPVAATAEDAADATDPAGPAAAPALVATERLPVAIWVAADVTSAEQAVIDRHPELTWHGDRPVAATHDAARAIRAELWEARRAVYDAARAPLAAEITALGGTVAYASTSAPMLFADLPAPSVAALAARGDVRSMGLEQGSAEMMTSAGPAVAADWSSGAADLGSGARVAVIEYLNVHNTGDLSGAVVASYSTSGSLAYGSGGGDHPTWVAGAIASHGAYPGTAPGAAIVSASTGGYGRSITTDRAIIAATDWAVSPSGGDADVINTSLGQDTDQGAEEARRYFDSIGWEDNRVPVSSSGNYGVFGHWDVVSPGVGWNVLTVGGINDRGTASGGDDILWYVPGSNGASYHDPGTSPQNLHGDFNKPNVSAPAVDVRTANGIIGSGTSVATPIVAGIAAQLVARDATLMTWPEAVRALIMAGATRRVPLPGGGVSGDHEGVGTTSALWSNRALERGAFGGYTVGSISASQSPTRQINVTAGQRVRIALSWSSHTSGGSNIDKADALTADLDLRVTAPDGTVTGSYSFDNNYEVVDLIASRNGTITAQVTHDRFEAGSEPYALAWTIGQGFTDAEGSIFEADIAWAYRMGITAGCAPGLFCPDDPVTREQMASFLVRALSLDGTGTDFFYDDDGSAHQSDINRLAASGIASGCGGGRFCPSWVVNREQMASFLARAFALPTASTDYFTDDAGSIHQVDINRLARSGITGGCGGTRYCPADVVTRGQMAAFLHRAIGG